MDEERRYRNGRDEVRNAHTPATNAPEAIAKAPANNDMIPLKQTR